MKKLILVMCSIFIFAGCSIGTDLMNTPMKKVEDFFGKYQMLDEEVMRDLDGIVKEDENFNTKQREQYMKIIKSHYEMLKYDIKDCVEDGDKATVEVEIEVKDYSRTLARTEAYMNDNTDEFKDEFGKYDKSKFIDYQLKELEKVDDTIVYTLSLSLTKQDDEWKLDPLTSVQEQKLHGVYAY